MSGYTLNSLENIPLSKEEIHKLRDIHATWLASQETQDLTWQLFCQETSRIKEWDDDNEYVINIGQYNSETMHLYVRIIKADNQNILAYYPHGSVSNMDMINEWLRRNIIQNRPDIKNHIRYVI